MEPLDKFNFEEEWRNAFQNASEQPPVEVWNAIERALDKETERKGVFWYSSNNFKIAAGVALVLIFGWLGAENFTPESKVVATRVSAESKQNKSVIISTERAGIVVPNKETSEQGFKIKNKQEVYAASNIKAQHINSFEKEVEDKELLSLPTKVQSVDDVESTIESSIRNLISAEVLASNVALQLPPNRLIRKLILDYVSVESLAQNTPSKREIWVGLQGEVGAFNPQFSASGLNAMASESFDSPYQQTTKTENTVGASPNNNFGTGNYALPTNQTMASESYRNGLTLGLKINKKWILETGLIYFRGNSNIQSNTYSIDALSGEKNTYLASYLSNNSNNAKQTQDAITTVADVGSFSNRYEYVSIPLQLGFTFFAKSKININLLAGASTDVFVGNVIGGNQNLNVKSYAIRQADGVYKPLNASVIGAARLSYGFQKNWSMYVGGQFQRGLSSMLLNPEVMDLYLRQGGVQYGLRRKF